MTMILVLAIRVRIMLFPRLRNHVLVVITRDESAYRARELNDALCVFYCDLLCFLFLVDFVVHRCRYKDISFDISISRIEFVEKMSALSIFCFSEINKECYLFHKINFLFLNV